MTAGVAFAALWVLGAPAFGAPGPEDDGALLPAEAKEEAVAPVTAAPPLPLADLLEDRWEWVPTGPTLSGAITDVAVAEDDARVVAASGPHGEVWVSGDGGFTWHEVLPPLTIATSGDEDAILDVEVRMMELMDELGVDQDAALDPSDGAGQALVDALQADVADGFAVRQGRVDPAVARRQVRTRVWLPGGGRLLVGRSDGLHDSRDLGERWTRVVDEPVHAWFSGEVGELVGTDEGVILLGRGGAQRRSSPGGAPVWDLALGGEAVVAATQQGAFSSIDGERWEPFGGLSEPLAAAIDDGVGGIWLGGDDVEMHGAGGEVAMFAVRDLARQDERLVSATGVGVRATVDAGDTWSTVAPSERPLDALAVAWVGETLLVGATDGLYRLAPPAPPGTVAPWIPLDALLAAAERRAGAEKAANPGPRGLVTMWMLPDVQVRFDWSKGGGTFAGLDAGLEGERVSDYGLVAVLTWRPPSGLLTAADALVSSDEDGELQVYLGGADMWLGLGRTDRRAAMHRQDVAREIVEVYRRRTDLVREQGEERTGRSLLDEVNLALRVAEAEAWLDALTDGAVRRYPEEQLGGVR